MATAEEILHDKIRLKLTRPTTLPPNEIPDGTSDYSEIMPECADFFLSHINEMDPAPAHEIPILFREYFSFQKHYFYCGVESEER